MKAPLRDIAWQSTGVSVLWDSAALHEVGPLSRALSLREFLCWRGEDFCESSPLARFLDEHRRRCVLVAGLEAALDVLEPVEADEWLEFRLQPEVRHFQSVLADGGSGCALVFWMVNSARFQENLADDSLGWECAPPHRSSSLRFSHGLWNGAQTDLQRIVPPGCQQPELGAGYYLRRIS